ncbi:MAG: pelota family protein [Candidatus Aenigmarchaeota archaeon]|nr:pelota family protein [Candidatus Aenigmarchaeota archaeon]
MRIIEKDKEGVSLVPETLNDLWYLYTVLEKRVVWTKTMRTKTVCKGGEVLKGSKKPCYLGILVEKLRWEETKLRATGTITEGEERNKHHSIDIELNEKLKVIGELEKIPGKEKREITACVVDKKIAVFGAISGRHANAIDEIRSGGREEEFYKEVAGKLRRMNPNYLIVAGPDKSKDRVLQLLDRKDSIFHDQTSSRGIEGIEELARRELVKRIFNLMREEAERKKVLEILAEVKKNPEKAKYGHDTEKETERIKEIIVVSSLVEKYENAMNEMEKNGAKVTIIDAEKDYASELRKFEAVGLLYW